MTDQNYTVTVETVVDKYQPLPHDNNDHQSEAQLECSFIAQLVSQGYSWLKIHRESDLVANLRTQLEALNQYHFSDDEWQHFFNDKIASRNDSIAEKTRRIQEDYVQVLKRDNGTSKNILLIDKQNLQRNRLQVINQYENGTENGAARDNRYDVTILVNGLPLVHTELKARGIPIRRAFDQINRYQRDSFWAGSGLFEYVQIFLISNGTNTKYYSNTTRFNAAKEHLRPGKSRSKTSNSFEFTSYWTDAANNPITDLTDFTRTFLTPTTLLSIITRYCVFTSDKSLLVMRPYQIVATERIINRIIESSHNGQAGTIQGGGYIWHTTGSGKTLTSFKTARLATKLPDIDKVIFVVDRRDLDYQTICEYDRFKKGAANGNTSTHILKSQLEDNASRIIITTIQKLAHFIKHNAASPAYSKHIVMIFDECHRSQFGEMHAAIVKHFTAYHLFGFTGTPIFAVNANTQACGEGAFLTTEQTFGDRLHSYTIVNAIADHNVLPFNVSYVSTMRAKDDLPDEKVPDIDRESLMLAPERISAVVHYILDNFARKTYRNSNSSYTYSRITNISEVAGAGVQKERAVSCLNGFNSIFAVSSVRAAQAYYNEFQRQMTSLPPEQRLRIATIFSFDPNEAEAANYCASYGCPIEDESPDNIASLDATSRDFLDRAIRQYNQTFKTNYDTSAEKFQNYYKDISLRMKNRDIDLLIVVNMFLTGFDATTLNTLWVDKNLRLHGLIQAFSRTNRILNSVKVCGNIVCFRNLQPEVNAAVSLFGDANAGGIVLLRSLQDYLVGFVSQEGKAIPGYYDMVQELKSAYPLGQPIVGRDAKRDFIDKFNGILRRRNILRNFDDFAQYDRLSEREIQDYTSVYQDIKHAIEPSPNEKVNVNDDVIFETELISSTSVDIDDILNLVKRYHSGGHHDKELLDTINHSIGASVELRSKKSLIDAFINYLNGKDIDEDYMNTWNKFAISAGNCELSNIIVQYNLKPDLTRRLIDNAFRLGELHDYGPELGAILPKVSLFSTNNARDNLKRQVFTVLQEFFEKYRNTGFRVNLCPKDVTVSNNKEADYV